MDMMTLRRNLVMRNSLKLVDYTVTGNPIAFNAKVSKSIKSISVPLSDIQPGSGDPSPTNIRYAYPMTGLRFMQAGKNMAKIRGYSASSKAYNLASDLTNNYGTTISSTSAVDSIVVTQSNWSTDYNLYDYKNGYFVIRLDENSLTDGKYYDVSFKVSNITNNPLNASLSDMRIVNGAGSSFTPLSVENNIVYFTHVRHKEGTNIKCSWDIRVCGMSLTISEFMMTPAYTNDGIYEVYNGQTDIISFPGLGKNKFSSSVTNGIIDLADGTIHYSSTKRLVSDYIKLSAGTYTLSNKENHQVTIYFYTSQSSSGYVSEEKISSWQNTPYTFTLSADRYAVFVFRNKEDTTISASDISEIQLESGSSATSYEEFDNYVFSGNLNIISGVLTVNSVYILAPWSSGTDSVSYTSNEKRKFTLPRTSVEAQADATGKCSVAKWLWDASSDTNHFYVDGNYAYVFLPVGTDENTPVQIVYELATPIVLNVGASNKTTRVGTNTLWTFAEDEITVVYSDKHS